MEVRFDRVPGVDCTAPAVKVVEGFAPKGGYAHGSLDIVVYVCEEHHEDARKKWCPSFGATTPYTLQGPPVYPKVCGFVADYRDTTGSGGESGETQDVGPDEADEATADAVMPRDPVELAELMAAEHAADEAEEMGLLEPMPYRLKVNGAVAMRGTLQEVRAAVAHLVTEWLADDPETLAVDAQTVNMAFNSGAVQQALDERGEWYTVVGSHSEHANRIKVEREA